MVCAGIGSLSRGAGGASNLHGRDPHTSEGSGQSEWHEDYNRMWQKTQTIWNIVAEAFLEDYDYFLLGVTFN